MHFSMQSAAGVFLGIWVLFSATFLFDSYCHGAPPQTRVQGPRQAIEPRAKPDLRQAARPTTLLIGDFVLQVESYSHPGSHDPAHGTITGASGTAWLTFHSDAPPKVIRPEGTFHKKEIPALPGKTAPSQTVQEVKRPPDAVLFIEREKEAIKALGLEPTKGGHLGFTPSRDSAAAGASIGPYKGDALLRFEGISISLTPGANEKGRVTAGKAVFPAVEGGPAKITLERAGFTLVIGAMEITPHASHASVTINLPKGMGAAFSCATASLSLGTVTLKADASFYADRPSEVFGPWIVGDTGLVATGVGYIADFSASTSPFGMPPSFKGLALKAGTASGVGTNPSESNTGFLAAEYQFPAAVITDTGFDAVLTSSSPFEFMMVNPNGYKVSAREASLTIAGGVVTGGVIGPGRIVLPLETARPESAPAAQVEATFATLEIQPDMDLAGEVIFEPPNRISWGELTHPGEEKSPWTLTATNGYLYGPAGPIRTFSPDTGSAFLDWHPPSSTPDMLGDMEGRAISGIAVAAINMDDLSIASPDRRPTDPLIFAHADGWMRLGWRGVDGELRVRPADWNKREPLGERSREGYVGGDPFDARIGISNKEKGAVFKFASSAVYDSDISGLINLKEPSSITGLAFSQMKTTSTAELVGGSITLPSGGVTLDYWRLSLVPTDDPAKAGFMSVRTGRILFTAAGISEPRHFDKPFRLVWGEMLASGNIGELFLDNNSYGQKFDKIKFAPVMLALSSYTPGATDGYLATAGTLYINFFGSAFVNIRDARHDSGAGPPHLGRLVTIPKTGGLKAPDTNLHLSGKWDDLTGVRLSTLDFPDADMGYNTAIQNGLKGRGKAEVAFVHSDGLDAAIEIRDGSIDICLTSSSTHDLDLGLYTRLGGLSGINGCIRILGPTLQRMVIGGYLERSVSTGTGIIEPRAGRAVEVITSVTPNACTFYASGDMFLSVAGAAVDLSGTVFLRKDFSRESVEGDVTAMINCNSVLGGLEGSGQVSWYADRTTQFFQGRMAVTIAGWSGGAGLEGGMFIGHNVPKEKAWVLQTTTGRFGVSQAQLPDIITGLYGYGQVSFAVNWYIFGGGVELYAGLGAFSIIPPGLASAWSSLAAVGLPYVIGSAGVCVHGEILGGLVSASGWCNLTMGGPIPITFEGTFGLEGCVLWVICASIDVTAGLGPGGFYIN
jgi:hypothetical protein